MRSVMSHAFSRVPSAEIQRSSFNRSHGVKTTFDAGYLVPFFVDEALPGDTFRLRTNGFSRLATPIYPLMDNIFLSTHYFAVPIRLLWSNWQRMNGEQDNPGDSTDYLVPTISAPADGYSVSSLYDYMGIPTGVSGLSHSALWFRAYNLIFNEWFRDQNLQDSLDVPLDDGPDDSTLYKLQRRGKRHDYFTSCLPWPQKGPDVTLPLGDVADVVGTGAPINLTSADGKPRGDIYNAVGAFGDGAERNFLTINDSTSGSSFEQLFFAQPTGLQAQLDAATAVSVNELRQAFQVQKMFERDARSGTRYTEILRAHFGVISPDARLQRPEYLGGGSSRVNITPIAQTSGSTSGSTVQGNLAAIGTTSFDGHGFTKSFTEHCVLIGLVSVRADLTYQQGLNKMFDRRDRFDFYWPSLAHLGEQAVLNREIYAQGTDEDDDVFGYQERYAEYRYKPSTVHGEFRSTHDEPLDAWHLSQEFADLPVLSDEFIQDDPPFDRVIAVSDEPHFIADFYHNLRCARPMPLFGVPGMMDRF